MMFEKLTAEKKSFFKTRGGSTYAIALSKDDKPTNFIRVDKDRRPVKIRKQSRRNEREMQAWAKQQAATV